MSHPDYDQNAYHHGCLLVLVRGIGQSKPRSLQKIFERLQLVNNVKISGNFNLLMLNEYILCKILILLFFFFNIRFNWTSARCLGSIRSRLSHRKQ